MKYSEFENILSSARMNRYLNACGGNTQKTMVLYRYNLRLSQELFTVISCFEVVLRNAINNRCIQFIGNDWLSESASNCGIFDNKNCSVTANNINEAKINYLRNRIAHHEPICFQIGHSVKDTTYVRQHYTLIQQLSQWMSIDNAALLYGIDHINAICNKIDFCLTL